jgi:hypothetical protein
MRIMKRSPKIIIFIVLLLGFTIFAGIFSYKYWQEKELLLSELNSTKKKLNESQNFNNYLSEEIMKLKNSILRSRPSTSEAKEIIDGVARNVLLALKGRDIQKFASFTHPDQNIVFSPYAYVGDVDFSKDEILNFNEDIDKYIWGTYDDSDEKIEMTLSEYIDAFVYDRDFLNAEEVEYMDDYHGLGAITPGLSGAFPNAVVVWYYFPHGKELDGRGLGLAFEKIDSEWFLVAVAHDEWTI